MQLQIENNTIYVDRKKQEQQTWPNIVHENIILYAI